MHTYKLGTCTNTNSAPSWGKLSTQMKKKDLDRAYDFRNRNYQKSMMKNTTEKRSIKIVSHVNYWDITEPNLVLAERLWRVPATAQAHWTPAGAPSMSSVCSQNCHRGPSGQKSPHGQRPPFGKSRSVKSNPYCQPNADWQSQISSQNCAVLSPKWTQIYVAYLIYKLNVRRGR